MQDLTQSLPTARKSSALNLSLSDQEGVLVAHGIGMNSVFWAWSYFEDYETSRQAPGKDTRQGH